MVDYSNHQVRHNTLRSWKLFSDQGYSLGQIEDGLQLRQTRSVRATLSLSCLVFDATSSCVQVNWVTGDENPLTWAELVNKLKDGLLYAFDSAITLRQEEVKRSENQQSMPGWNFCTFFILKVSFCLNCYIFCSRTHRKV